MPISKFILFRVFDGYAAYLSEQNGCLINCVSRVLLITYLLVHIINDLEILCLLLLIQRLHICWLFITFLQQVLGLSQRSRLSASRNFQTGALRVFLDWSLRESLLSLFDRFFAALC